MNDASECKFCGKDTFNTAPNASACDVCPSGYHALKGQTFVKSALVDGKCQEI